MCPMSEGLAGKGLIPGLGSTGQLTACLSCRCELLESLRNSVSLGPSQGKAEGRVLRSEWFGALVPSSCPWGRAYTDPSSFPAV